MSHSNLDNKASRNRGPTTREEYEDSFGGYENFMHSFGLKPWDCDDMEEGQAIMDAFIKHDNETEASQDSSSYNIKNAAGISEPSMSANDAQREQSANTQSTNSKPNVTGKPKPKAKVRSNYEIYASFGGYNNFMASYGLKPWDDDDVEEGKAIVEAMRESDEIQE